MASDLFERCVVAGNVICNDKAIMGSYCNNSVIGGVLNALNRFTLAVAALAQDIELSVKGLKFAIHEADTDVLTIV